MSLSLGKLKSTDFFSSFIFLMLCIYYFLFFSGFSSARALQVLVLLIAYAWFFFRAEKFRFFFPVKVALLFTVVYILNAVSLYVSGESWSGYSFRDSLNFFAFIPFAFVVYENFSKRHWLYFFLVLGIVAMPWLGGNGWDEFQLGVQGARVEFGRINAQHTGMLFGVLVLLSCSAFVVACSKKRYWLPVVFLTIATVFFVFVVSITQMRAVFLALLICFFVFSFYVFFRLKKHFFVLLAFFFVVVFFVVQLGMHEGVKNRYISEMVVVEHLAQGELEKIPPNSLGIRVYLWKEGWEYFKERPILGWSDGGPERLLKSSEIAESRLKGHDHFHNVIIHLLVSLGISGFLLTAALMIWLVSYVVKIGRSQYPLDDWEVVFISLFMVYFLIVNLFEQYYFYASGVNVFNLVCSVLVAAIMKHQSSTVSEQRSKCIS